MRIAGQTALKGQATYKMVTPIYGTGRVTVIANAAHDFAYVLVMKNPWTIGSTELVQRPIFVIYVITHVCIIIVM